MQVRRERLRTILALGALLFSGVRCEVVGTGPITANLDSTGGTFGDPSGILSVVVPANAVVDPVRVTIRLVGNPPVSARLLPSTAVEITLEPDIDLLLPALLTVNYGSLNVPVSLPVASLRLGKVGPLGWAEVPSSNFPAETKVVASVTDFSTFGLIGQPLGDFEAASAIQLSGSAGGAATPLPTVRVTDIDGAGVEGVPVTWAVTAGGGVIAPPSVATDNTGLASATSWTLGAVAGLNTATANVNGAGLPTVSFSAVTGAPPPASDTFPNEPPGFVIIREDNLTGPIWLGNGFWRDGWVVENLIDPAYKITMGLATDGSATITPPTTLQFAFDTSSRSGGGPRVARTFTGADHIYVSVHFQLSPGYTSNWGPGLMKLLVIEPNNVIVSLNHWNPQNNGGGPRSTLVDVWSRLNNGGHDYLNTFQPAGIRTWQTVSNVTWHQFEMRAQRGAAAGQGSLEWWLDGVLQGQHTGLTFGTAANGAPFGEIKLTPQMGGAGAPSPGAMTIRMDHVRVSRAP